MWEYKTIFVKWDSALAAQNEFDPDESTAHKEQAAIFDWVAEYEDGYKDIGWAAILNEWGSFGWELVNVTAAEFSETVTTAYFAFFKRKMVLESDSDDDNS